MKMNPKTLRFYGPERKKDASGMNIALFRDFIYGLGEKCYKCILRYAGRIIMKSA